VGCVGMGVDADWAWRTREGARKPGCVLRQKEGAVLEVIGKTRAPRTDGREARNTQSPIG
jgi:hypothetical protein